MILWMSALPLDWIERKPISGNDPKQDICTHLFCCFLPSPKRELRKALKQPNPTDVGLAAVLWIRRDLLCPATPNNRPQPSGVGLPPKRSLSLRSICFVVPPAFAKTAFRNAVEQQNPAVAGLLFVDPEGFEPSSSHGTIYAFYMLSFRLFVGKGKAGCLPIPFSVVALSHRPVATPSQPAP